MKNLDLRKYIIPLFSFLVAISVFLFWYVAYPQALSYQEQNQLFLWSWDYFCNDTSQMGGFADWLGEFVVQFYYVEWFGALLLGIAFMLLHYIVSFWLKVSSQGGIADLHISLISVVPCIILLMYMGDENVLMSYVMGIILSSGIAFALRSIHPLADIILVPLLYWMVGPVVWLYVCLKYCVKDKWKYGVVVAVYLAVIQIVVSLLFLSQWSLIISLCGLNYYRIPLEMPTLQIVIPLVIVLLTVLAKLKMPEINDYLKTTICLLILISMSLCIDKCYNKEKYELLRQDYLIRNERWQDIIRNAEQYEVKTTFSSNAVNLALAMTGQLADRMFSFYQSGGDALVMPMVRDNTSNLPTMEAFFRLGMVNESMRYAFDLQESILNGKKSGRLLMRIVECCIINGKYQIAEKYLDMLTKSLFYKKWADRARQYLGQEQWIDTHERWGHIRQMRYKSDFLYNYGERDKMFGILVMENSKNKMALEYFLGQLLLNGEMKMFMQYLPLAQQYGDYKVIPYGYQDAWKCIQAQGQVSASPYASYVKRMTASKTTDGTSGASLLMK